MSISNYIKNLDHKILLLVFTLMGITGGYTILSPDVEFTGKLLFSCYGMIIGALLGFGTTILLNYWKASRDVKVQTLMAFLFLGIAPMFLVYYDFEEHIQSNKGLIIMLVVDLLVLTLLVVFQWNGRRKLIPVFLLIPLWQVITLSWFICLTWAEMNYWD